MALATVRCVAGFRNLIERDLTCSQRDVPKHASRSASNQHEALKREIPELRFCRILLFVCVSFEALSLRGEGVDQGCHSDAWHRD